jgi:hypothetical protein
VSLVENEGEDEACRSGRAYDVRHAKQMDKTTEIEILKAELEERGFSIKVSVRNHLLKNIRQGNILASGRKNRGCCGNFEGCCTDTDVSSLQSSTRLDLATTSTIATGGWPVY